MSLRLSWPGSLQRKTGIKISESFELKWIKNLKPKALGIFHLAIPESFQIMLKTKKRKKTKTPLRGKWKAVEKCCGSDFGSGSEHHSSVYSSFSSFVYSSWLQRKVRSGCKRLGIVLFPSVVVRARVVSELGLHQPLCHSSTERWTHPSASLSYRGGECTPQPLCFPTFCSRPLLFHMPPTLKALVQRRLHCLHYL